MGRGGGSVLDPGWTLGDGAAGGPDLHTTASLSPHLQTALGDLGV